MPARDARSAGLHERLDMNVSATMETTRGKQENRASSFAVIMSVSSAVRPVPMRFIHTKMQAGNVDTLHLAKRRINESKEDAIIEIQKRKSLAPSFTNNRASTDV